MSSAERQTTLFFSSSDTVDTEWGKIDKQLAEHKKQNLTLYSSYRFKKSETGLNSDFYYFVDGQGKELLLQLVGDSPLKPKLSRIKTVVSQDFLFYRGNKKKHHSKKNNN